MLEYDSGTKTKIAALRTMFRTTGNAPSAYELLKIEWGDDPADHVYYSCLKLDEIGIAVPPVSPIEVRLIPDSSPNWFLPVNPTATIGDDEVEFKLSDTDGVIGGLLDTHGEGCKVIPYYWLPDEELLLEQWHAHLRFEEEAGLGEMPLKAAQGFRAADGLLPSGGHYPECQSIFGGVLTTQAEIDEHSCNYNKHLGGSIGINNPLTGLPFTFCPRKVLGDCVARGIDPLRHQSFQTIRVTVINNQTSGGPLFSTSAGNETSLKDPPRVVMGQRRVYGMKVLNFRRDLNTNNPDHGWFAATYEGGYGPVGSITGAIVGGQPVVGMHYYWKLGEFGQTPVANDLSTHGYSGIWLFRYNLGWVNAAEIDENSITAEALTTGLSNIRTYTDDDPVAYTEGTSRNRVWQIMHALTNKTWGVGYDYDHFNITSWMAAAAWAEETVRYTDPDDANWDHIRAASDVDWQGKKVQQQIADICKAGRLSHPFLFNGQIHIVPLRALTVPELAACPLFTDEGSSPNIIREGDGDDARSTLRYSRKSGIDLPNRIECTYDDVNNNYLETTAPPVEDVDAQLAAGRVQGKKDRRVNSKSHSLMGVTSKAQAVKLAFSFLDLGESDEGGLRNNGRVTFKTWYLETLDLHPHKVIQLPADHWIVLRFGFSHFRILPDGIEKEADLSYKITAQAYPTAYMNAFETVIVTPPTGGCSIDSDCDAGFHCENGVCVPDIEPPPCVPTFGTVSLINGVFEIPIEPCLET